MQCHDAWNVLGNDVLKINEIVLYVFVCICYMYLYVYAMKFVKWCMNAICECINCSLQCRWTRENKSLIVVGDEECKPSNFVEVEMLRDRFPLLEK